MIYVYAISDLDALPDVADGGIGGAPLILHSRCDLAVICREHDQSIVQPDAENILKHERVIEACMEIGTVLPARFGTCFANVDRLDAVLDQNAQRLHEGLARVRGCVEMGVRVLWTGASSDYEQSADPTPASTGTAYMLHRAKIERARVDAQSRADRAAHELHADLSQESVDGQLRMISAPLLHLSGAYLVRRDRMTHFQQRVRELAASHPELHILGTGPWPPYHFTPALNLQNSAEVCHA